MASEPEAAADAAARLEAALERIARRATAPAEPAAAPAGPSRAILIARLDQMIARLRGALDRDA